MRLQHELVLPQARIKKVKIDLGEEEHKVALEFRAALTQEVAEAFGCRELIYAGSVPRSGVGKMDLEGSEIDCTVRLMHPSFSFEGVVSEMGKYVAHMEGTGPQLAFQLKLAGYVSTVADLIDRVKVDPLEVTLKPSQLDLGLQEEGKAAAKAEPEDGPCVDCNNDIPLNPGFPLTHASGQVCMDPERHRKIGGSAPALASVVEMGGSHQKGNPKKHGRRQPVEEPEPAEAEHEQVAEGQEEEEDFISQVVQ